jgi:hypothetical protein
MQVSGLQSLSKRKGVQTLEKTAQTIAHHSKSIPPPK